MNASMNDERFARQGPLRAALEERLEEARGLLGQVHAACGAVPAVLGRR
ncbi:hypothetical protein [Streptomyces avermitilis]